MDKCSVAGVLWRRRMAWPKGVLQVFAGRHRYGGSNPQRACAPSASGPASEGWEPPISARALEAFQDSLSDPRPQGNAAARRGPGDHRATTHGEVGDVA